MRTAKHEFVGCSDRWCEVCNEPDRHSNHTTAISDVGTTFIPTPQQQVTRAIVFLVFRCQSSEDAYKHARAYQVIANSVSKPWKYGYNQLTSDLWFCRAAELAGAVLMCASCGAIGPDNGDCMACGASFTPPACGQCQGIGTVPVENAVYEFGSWESETCEVCEGSGDAQLKFSREAEEFAHRYSVRLI